jgi:ribonucleoside-diphosphate reductase alpha subunit
VAKEVIASIYSGVTTKQLDEEAARIAATYSNDHPDYALLAGNLCISRHHKETKDDFIQLTRELYIFNIISNEYMEKVERFNKEIFVSLGISLNEVINYELDYDFSYFGWKTLEKSYLLKVNDKIVERPQHLYMREAIAVSDTLEEVIETYQMLSSKEYTHATPTMFYAGVKNGQLASCFLINNKGDSRAELMQTTDTVSAISCSAGGIGLSISNVRAAGSHIAGSGGKSNGILPLLRTYNELAKWWDQGGGKRKGSFAMYIEPWHKDVEILLDIRKNHGKEEFRARELFPALWIPDLFMKMVEQDGDWYLMCPNEVIKAGIPALDECYGGEFEQNYYRAVEMGLGKKIKAQDLWIKIIEAQTETGTPFMLYKDQANKKSNQKNLGTIKSSNLCTEIIEYTDKDEVAVCNLASIALSKFVKPNGDFDFERLKEVAYKVTLRLNNVIDITYYPVKEAKHSNLRHRPIGIGVQGLADAFAMMQIPFESDLAREINLQIFETIYYAAVRASIDLAAKHGPYETFEGSPASQGLLQYDMWGVEPITNYDWKGLKADLDKYGMRNSLLVAPMPTASTSQIMGNNEAFEPYTSNMYVRRVLSGEFNVVNKHLVKDLEALGLWTETIKNKIILDKGSVQNIEEIPQHLKEIYKTVWEISMKTVIDMAADRGAFIDQSQSMNLWMASPNFGKISSMHFYAWKKGLKTGMYYLRTKAAVDANKNFGIDVAETKVSAKEAIACSLDNPDACEACGS